MIYAIRHGQDDERFIGGWSNGKLTRNGINDVKFASLWIRDNLNISNIISSDIRRAKETSQIINGYLKVPLQYNEILREQNKGLLNGLDINIAKKTYQNFLNNVGIDTVYPNGESLRDLYRRIINNLNYFEMISDNTLLVTHRGVINMLYYILNNKELDMDKSQFGVSTSSIHEIDFKNKLIRKVR